MSCQINNFLLEREEDGWSLFSLFEIKASMKASIAPVFFFSPGPCCLNLEIEPLLRWQQGLLELKQRLESKENEPQLSHGCVVWLRDNASSLRASVFSSAKWERCRAMAMRTSWVTMKIRWGYRLGRCSRHTALSRVSCYHWPDAGEKPSFVGHITSVLSGLGLIQLGVKHCQSRDTVMLCHLRVADWTQLWIFPIFSREILIPFPSGNTGWCFTCVRGRSYIQRNLTPERLCSLPLPLSGK